MVQGIFAARLLGAEGFGLLSATIIPFVSTVNRLSSFRMSELVVKYLGEHLAEDRREHAAAIVKGAALTDALASAFGFLLLIALAPLASSFLAKDPAAAPLFLTYGVILLANGTFETATGILQARDRFRAIAAINLIQSSLTAGLILAAFFTQQGLIQVLYAYLWGKVFAGLTTSAVAYREIQGVLRAGWWRQPLATIEDWGGIARFALSTNLSGTVNLITRDSETLWVSLLRNPTEAGYYKIALGVINLVMLPVQPLIGTTYAEFSRTIAQRQWQQTSNLLRRVSGLAGAWTLAAALGLSFFGSWVISRLYGAAFAPAYPALLLLLIGYGVANILFWNRPLLLALGLPTYPLKTAAAAGLVKTALTLWLVPAYSYLAQAALLSAYFVLSIGANVYRGLGEIRLRRRAAL